MEGWFANIKGVSSGVESKLFTVKEVIGGVLRRGIIQCEVIVPVEHMRHVSAGQFWCRMWKPVEVFCRKVWVLWAV